MHHCKLKSKSNAGHLLNINDLVLISSIGMVSGTPLYFRCSQDSSNMKSSDLPSIINNVRDIFNQVVDPHDAEIENKCFIILKNAHLFASDKVIKYEHLIVYCEQINGVSFGSLF